MTKEEAEKRLFKARTEIEAVARALEEPDRRDYLRDARSICGSVVSELREGSTKLKKGGASG